MWQLKRNQYHPKQQMVEESLFTLGNGYLGMRGAFEEGYPEGHTICGTYINGLYDHVPMIHAEMAYGFPEWQDKQPRVVDTQKFYIYCDDEKVQLQTGKYEHYERVLDYKSGEGLRQYDFRTQDGKVATVVFKRLIPFVHKHFILYRYEINYPGNIKCESHMINHVENFSDPMDPRVGKGHTKLMAVKEAKPLDDGIGYSFLETSQTKISLYTYMTHHVISDEAYTMTTKSINENIVTMIQGKNKIIVEKKVFMSDSLREKDPKEKALIAMQQHNQLLYQDYLEEQRQYLEAFWRQSDIVIQGNIPDQQALRLMLFQTLQSTGVDEFSNISAKGLSGEGYEGHYFWDTEIYILPTLIMNQPERAKKLLEYRYHILPMAKLRATELGHKTGAAYPWRTISGIESSGYFPAGTAQYHINSDIAYGFIQYHLMTDDWQFMVHKGLEVIVETARTWIEIGHFHEGSFMIHHVTGPDEYTAIVSNNYYTNVMAKYHLKWAEKLYHQTLNHQELAIREKAQRVFEKIDFKTTEAELMSNASEAMYLPYDKQLGLFAQDDTFLSKAKWPTEDPFFSKRPLLLHYHPLTIYRHQVLKQADVLLAHFLLEDGVSTEAMVRGFDYYESITTHDSSLSPCIYGMMASRCGKPQKAYHYFQESLFLDIKDTKGNTKDGLHMANAGGSIMAVFYGFAGLRIKEEGLYFRPDCPRNWEGYQFLIQYKESQLKVTVDIQFKIELLSGPAVQVTIDDIIFNVTEKTPAKKMLSSYQGFVFDLDGVLTETSRLHFQAWQQLAKELGFDLNPTIEDEVRGISRLASLEIILKAGKRENDFSHNEKIALAEHKNKLYKEGITNYSSKNLYPGVYELLSFLKEQGFKIALASASASGPFLLEKMGIQGFFDVVVDPKSVEKGKPAPDIFMKACELLDLPPYGCIGVEDAYAGVESIRAAKLTPIGIGDKDRLNQIEKVFPTIDDLWQHIKPPTEI